LITKINGLTTSVQIYAVGFPAWRQDGWAKDIATAWHCRKILEMTRFKNIDKSNETRMDIATSVTFGLLAVSNQLPLEC